MQAKDDKIDELLGLAESMTAARLDQLIYLAKAMAFASKAEINGSQTEEKQQRGDNTRSLHH